MPETREHKKLMDTLKFIRTKTDFKPKIGLILGSGLGDFVDNLKVEFCLPYSEIPNFPCSTVQGHKGQFIFGFCGNVPIVAMQGRVHYYEGYEMSDVVLPTRLMGLLGAEILFLTNAAGGINESFVPGTLMILTDHINVMVPNPLIGENMDDLGRRFPDMSEIYRKELIEKIEKVAKEENIPVKKGVYYQYSGPSFETPAEIKMIRGIGGDACGMSTACEAVAGNHMGMKVCGISCITNLAAGMSGNPLTHEEVQETTQRVKGEFSRLVEQAIKIIGE